MRVLEYSLWVVLASELLVIDKSHTVPEDCYMFWRCEVLSFLCKLLTKGFCVQENETDCLLAFVREVHHPAR